MGDMKMSAWIVPVDLGEADPFPTDLALMGAAGGNVVGVPTLEDDRELVGAGVGVDVRPPCPLY